VFSVLSVLRCYKQGTCLEVSQSVKRRLSWSKSSVVGYPSDSNDVSTGAEETPLL
jgi:hypothetical protein